MAAWSQQNSTRHLKFYFDGDASTILWCDGYLYKIHKDILCKQSEFFREMFTMDLPEKTDPAGQKRLEGTEDSHPIIIHGVSRSELDHLMTFFYEWFSQIHNPSVDYLVSVLKLSHLYIIPNGLVYAKNALHTHPDLSAALQMQLAHKYHDIASDWIEPAFRTLVTRSMADITIDEMWLMGAEVYFVVVRTKSQLDTLVRKIAYCAPEVDHGLSCNGEERLRCGELWKNAWWAGLARQLLHPDRAISMDRAVRTLEDVVIPGVSTVCKEWTMEKMREMNPFAEAEKIIGRGLAMIMLSGVMGKEMTVEGADTEAGQKTV